MYMSSNNFIPFENLSVKLTNCRKLLTREKLQTNNDWVRDEDKALFNLETYRLFDTKPPI